MAGETTLEAGEAIRLKLLQESLDRNPPEPTLDGMLPADEAFYEGDVPSWSPDESESEADK